MQNNVNNPFVTPYQFKLEKLKEGQEPKTHFNPGLTFFDQLVINLAGTLLPTSLDRSKENAEFVVRHAENVTKFRLEALERLKEASGSQNKV